MLLRSRSALTASMAAGLLLWANMLVAQNTAPVPTTFEIVSPGDGNAASLINSNYSVNNRIFYGGDFALVGDNNNLGFKGFTNPGDPEGTRIARGNLSGSRLTLGGTETGADVAYPNYGVSRVAPLGSFTPTLVGGEHSYDPDDLGFDVVACATWLNYKGGNGFIAINEGDTLEINITGFIDPNNKMVQGDKLADDNYSGRFLRSQNGNGVQGNDGANNVTYALLNPPQGASFVGSRFRWVPSFIQGDGNDDDSQYNGVWFIDANISDGDTQTELGPGTETDGVTLGRGKGELKDSLYVLYFQATDDGNPVRSGIDSLFILVNDSLPNPPPRFTQRTLLRKDSLGVQQQRTFNYLAGQPDTLFSVFEGDSVVITFFAQDQDGLQGEIDDTIAFGMLWDDDILGVSKGGSTSGAIAGFNQFISRAGTVDTLVADTLSTLVAGSATSFRVRLQIPYNLATSSEKADSMVVMVSDGNTIVADTFALKVRNTNRAPVWDADTTSTPSDSALAYSPSSILAASDSTQPIGPFTLNNNQTDSTYFGLYVYDPDVLIGDNQGVPLTFSATGDYKGTLNPNTGLNVYLPSESDTVTYIFTITATDSYSADRKSTAQEIRFRVAPAPTITRVEPASGSINHEFTIYGSGFGLYDNTGVDTSRVEFFATTNGVRQYIPANIIAWSKNKIVASIPPGVPPSGLDATRNYLVPDTIIVRSAIYGGFDTYPFTVLVDSTGFDNLEIVSLTTTSAVVRYRTNFTGADSVVVAASSDTLDIHSTDFTLPTFVEYNGGLSLIRSSVQVFHDQTSSSDGVHVIQLTDLTPSTLYRFFIGSSNGIYAADSLRNVNGPYRPKKINTSDRSKNKALDAFRFRTLPSGGASGNMYTLVGKVYYSGGAAEDASVSLRVVKSDSPADTSLPIATVVGSDSTWLLNLGNLRSSDGSSFNHSEGDYLLFEFDGSEMGYQEYDTTRAGGEADTIRNIKLVPYVEYDMELKTGLNLIGLPLRLFKGEPADAYSLLGRITGGSPSITRYVTATGTQQTITRSIQGGYIGAANFDLEPKEGYFLTVNTKTNLNFKGRVHTEPLTAVDFPGAGLYFISVPGQDTDLFYSWDALQVLQYVSNVTEVIRWNALLQQYEQYLNFGGGYTGTNFAFEVGEGYILNVSGPSSWDPHGPSTLLASASNDDPADRSTRQAIVIDMTGQDPAAVNSALSTVSNISSSSAVLMWMTGTGEPGQIRISLKDGSGEMVVKPELRKLSFGMSYALITGLKAESDYVYRVESSSGMQVDGRAEGTFTTARIGVGMEPYSLFGRLVDTRGQALPGMLLLVKLQRAEQGLESGYLSAVSDKDGYWVVNLANLKEKDTGKTYNWKVGDRVELVVVAGAFRSVFTTTVAPGSPHNIALDLQNAGDTGQSVQEKQPAPVSLPRAYALAQNFPNPFNPSTTIQFSIPERIGLVKVRLDVYNLRGQLVTTLVDRPMEAGDYRVQWEGTDNSGKHVSSGVYFYRLTTPDFKATRKMVILK